MPAREPILWDVLDLMRNRNTSVSLRITDMQFEDEYENAVSIGALKRILVLTYLPADIEDTLYFLEHRGYLNVHGRGLAAPKMVYSMTSKAIEVHSTKSLPGEERAAFDEALWDLRPGYAGIGFNLREGWRRLRRWLSRPSS